MPLVHKSESRQSQDDIAANRSKRYMQILAVFISILVSFILSMQGRKYITEKGIRWGDDRENLSMAYNLYKYGVLSVSKEEDSPPFPSCNREPVTPFMAAIFMHLYPGFNQDWTLEELLQSGKPIKTLKYVNIVWLFLSLLGAWWSVRLLGGNLITASFTTILVYAFSFFATLDGRTFYSVLGNVMSETPSIALIIWSGVFLVLAYKRKKAFPVISAGVVFGLLALTKATFYYVFFPIPLIFIGLLLLDREPLKKGLILSFLFLLGFSLTVYPYMIRNYYHFNQLKISDRGGRVLLLRAYKNEMTWTEIKGAFYHWAPRGYQPAIGKVLGFSDQDLMLGGSLQRLNRHIFVKDPEFEALDRRAAAEARPDDAISFVYTQQAERAAVDRMIRRTYSKEISEGSIDAFQEIDRHLRNKAKTMIMEKPIRHLLLTPLFFWRGIGEVGNEKNLVEIYEKDIKKPDFYWCPNIFYSGVFRSTARIIMYLSLFSLPFLALWRNRFELILFTLPAIGMLFFFALFSHNIMRYSIPANPIMIISLCILLCWFLQSLYRFLLEYFDRGEKDEVALDDTENF